MEQIKVLLIEDDMIAQKMAARILSKLNCLVDTAASADQAFEYATKNIYEIIFCDIGLPDCDGLILVEKIRKTQGINKTTPIVILSAQSTDDYKDRAAKVGANNYIVKPLSADIAEKMLKKYLPSNS